MKQKLLIALLIGAFGTAANATCWLTPQGCGTSTSNSSSTSNGGNSASNSNATGGSATANGNGGHASSTASVNNSGNSSISNSGNSSNRNSNSQDQSQHQHQVANGGNATGGASFATGGQGGVGGTGNGGTGVGSQGQTSNVSVDSHVEAQKRAAASAFAAPLTSSNDTCMGSSSGAVQAPGLGISVGSTWTDKNCVMLKNSRELWNMGFKEAALARMCMDSDNKDALEASGIECPTRRKSTGDSSAPTVTSSTSASGSDGWDHNDPYIYARMKAKGLVN